MIELILALAVSVPMPPKAVVVTNVLKPQTITLEWQSPYSNFVLNVGNQSRKYSAHIPIANTNSVTVTNLYKTNNYYFAVTAKQESQESDYSNELKWPTNSINVYQLTLQLNRGNSYTNLVTFTNIPLLSITNPVVDTYYNGKLILIQQ